MNALVCSCGDENSDRDSESSFSFEESAMSQYKTSPLTAISILDSAVSFNEITRQQANYLKAKVLYEGLNNPDSCITICKKLIEDNAWEKIPNVSDAFAFQVGTFKIMSSAEQDLGRNLATIHDSQEGIKLAHEIDSLRGDEEDLRGSVGLVMIMMGDNVDGFRTLEEAVNSSQKDNTWASFTGYLNLTEKFLKACDVTKQHKRMCEVGKQALQKLSEFEKDPQDLKNIPHVMKKGSSELREFVQSYSNQFVAYISKGYAEQNKIDSARVWYKKLNVSAKSQYLSLAPVIVSPLITLGNYDEAAKLITAKKDILGNDTVSRNYRDLLNYEFKLAKKTGNRSACVSLGSQMLNISYRLNSKKYCARMADALAQYRVLEERQKREDAEKRLQNYTVIFIITLVMIVSCFLLYIIRMRTQDKKK